MKLRLRRHETRETLKLDLADTVTLHDLRRRINASEPNSVHLSLNRKDELLSPAPKVTIRSLGVTSGDLVYYSLDRSAFVESVHEIGVASSPAADEPDQATDPRGESPGETLDPKSESNHAFVSDSMVIESVDIKDQSKSDVEDPVAENPGMEGPDPMDVVEELDVDLADAGSKRLNEPFFLKKIILGKSGDTSELTTLALSVHAVMLESGFVLYDHGSDKFSFSKVLLSVSIRYTLPELITRDDGYKVEFVTVKFQTLGYMVVVYGILGRCVSRVPLDKRRFVPVIDLVMDTLKSDKEGSSSIYREVFMFWRMVKDGLVTPLLIGLCDKAGFELPPCLIRLPTELKLKIMEFIPGASLAKMSCVSTEMRYLASDNDLWLQKYLEESKDLVSSQSGGDSVNWKAEFSMFWRRKHRHRKFAGERRRFGMRGTRNPFPRIIRDPHTWFNGDHLHCDIGIHPGQPARGLGGRAFEMSFRPGCNLGGNN
ncbi:unnamed protein product [Cochlearia groenlandica]